MIIKPLITVIIPVYNTEKYLEESINSVLNQTYKNIQLICVNDGSTDNSINILESFGKKIILVNNEQNLGIAQARNKGIELVTSDFIAFNDADDIWDINKLEVQIDQFKNNPDLDICFTYMKCFLSPDLSDEIKKVRYCPPLPMPGHVLATALIKFNSFKKVGNFDPKWKVGEFIDWFNKAKEIGLNFLTLNDISFFRRIHATNTGVTERKSKSDYLKIIRESLERKKNRNI